MPEFNRPPARLRRVVVRTPNLASALGFFGGVLQGHVIDERDGACELVWARGARILLEEQPGATPGIDRLEVEVRRDDWQVLERPLALLDVVLSRHHQRQQVADRRGNDVVLALEIVSLAREAAERASDIGGDGGLLGDDELFSHGARKAADDKCKLARRSTGRGENALQRARARARDPLWSPR